MFWLFLRFVAMPYLSIRTWIMLGKAPYSALSTRLKLHRAITDHLMAELSRMRSTIKPRYQAFLQLSWVVFVVVQGAVFFVNFLSNSTPSFVLSTLHLIQLIAASLAGFIIFFLLKFAV
jgi:hypothetical protein